MTNLLQYIFDYWFQMIPWLISFAVVFSLLAQWMPCNPGQPLLRKGIVIDLLYCLVVPFFTRIVRLTLLVTAASLYFGHDDEAALNYLRYGYGPLAALPLWFQAALILLLSDVYLYWMHRWLHGRRLWAFHAIHHSPEQVDWLSTYRFHPINTWVSFTLADVIMLWAGFSPAALGVMAGVNVVYSAMVHANLNWTFGPFKYLFASPVFHRWHHTSQKEGMDKNFAPTFPLLDVVFGTFYMPEGKLPQHYGAPGTPVPDNFIGQIIWPFKKR